MKEVYYSEDKIFTITDREYDAAKVRWEEKKDYDCPRLGALLSPYFKFVETPARFLHRDVYMEKIGTPGHKFYREVFQLGDGSWREICEDGYLMETKLFSPEEELVSQEDFYDRKEGGILSLREGTGPKLIK